MRGQVILPRFYRTRHTDNYKILLQCVANRYDLDLVYTDNIRIRKNDEIVITHGIPHHNFPNYDIRPLLDKPDRTTLISWLRDPWCLLSSEPQRCMQRYADIIEASDFVLQFANAYFHKTFPNNEAKTFFFPQFVAPKERYAEVTVPRKFRRCLLSGALGAFYPLRTYVAKNAPKNLVEHIPPPYKGEHSYVREEYAKLLGKYFCCVTDGGVVQAAMAKHIEIPASGSLLICDQTSDLDTLGFVPGQHYVKVHRNNVLEKLDAVLRNPRGFEKIANEGRAHALANHTMDNRLSQIVNIIDNM